MTVDNRKALLIEQEIKMARALAGNSKQVRDKALKSLKKWFQNPIVLEEDDFMRLWQGLFYTLWMSDKPLIQEECADNIAKLIHLSTVETTCKFFKTGLNTLIEKWLGIDQLRLDKFLMFIRRFLRQMFFYLNNNNYEKKMVEKYNSVLSETVFSKNNVVPVGFVMHIVDIYLEEFAKINENKHEKLLVWLLKPFVVYIATSNDVRLINHIQKHVFRYLFRQSDLGIEYHEKFRAWKKLGFPGKSVHDLVLEEVESDEETKMEEDKDEDDEENQYNLDARAGRVDVVLKQIKFNSDDIIKLLTDYKFAEGSNSKSRKIIKKLIDEFTLFSKGIYPLGTRPDNVDEIVTGKNKTNTNANTTKKTKRKSNCISNTIEDKDTNEGPKNKVPKLAKRLEKPVGSFERNSGMWVVYKENHPKITGESDKSSWDVSTIEGIKKSAFNGKINCTQTSTDEVPLLKRDKKVKKTKEKNSTSNPSLVEDSNIKLEEEKNSLSQTTQKDSKKSVDTTEQFKNNCIINLHTISKTNDFSKNGKEANKKIKILDSLVIKPSNDAEGLIKNNLNIFQTTSPRVLRNKENQKNKENSPKNVVILSNINLDTSNVSAKVEKTPEQKKKSPKKSNDGNIKVSTPLNGVPEEFLFATPTNKSPKAKQSMKTPESQSSKIRTPSSSSKKKVNINLKLNRSQEVHEHIKKIKSSPGLPYDAKKQPTKPLLKPFINSPINPFYKKKLNL